MKKLAIFALVAVICLVTACTTTKQTPTQGASNEKYFLGTYSAMFTCDLRMLDKAIRETCNKSRLIEVERNTSLNACHYLYKDINDIKVKFTTVEKKNGAVKLSIRVGGTGDKESSQILLLEIDSQLRSQGSI